VGLAGDRRGEKVFAENNNNKAKTKPLELYELAGKNPQKWELVPIFNFSRFLIWTAKHTFVWPKA
jgi:hypothetical protein